MAPIFFKRTNLLFILLGAVISTFFPTSLLAHVALFPQTTQGKAMASASARRILVTEVSLEREGQETTAFRFALDEDGALVPGSVHDLPKALRGGQRG